MGIPGIGTLAIQPDQILGVAPLGPAAAAPFDRILPGNPAAAGTTLYLQGMLVDPFAAEPFRLTNGLQLTIASCAERRPGGERATRGPPRTAVVGHTGLEPVTSTL